MERRAVMVSHELWKQIMTQGYESGGITCVQGLPEDAELVGVFDKFNSTSAQLPDVAFVFKSGSWTTDTPSYTVKHRGVVYPVMDIVFRSIE
jgi:hypothetical protein